MITSATAAKTRTKVNEKKQGGEREPQEQRVIRVVENQLDLPLTSPSAVRVSNLLAALITLVGEVWTSLGRAARDHLVIEYDPEDKSKKRIVRAQLQIPAYSLRQVEQARKLLDPVHQTQKKARKEAKRLANGGEPKKPKKLSPKMAALPDHLKLNACGLVEIREQAEGGLPLLIFRVMEEYRYFSGKEEKEVRTIWQLDAQFLQAVLQNYLRFQVSNYAHLPPDMAQMVAQKIAELTLSHLGLKESKTQPYTSFAALQERNPEKHLAEWRAAVTRVNQRREPFARRKHRGELVIDDPDVTFLRKGPYPKRMTAGWISGDSVIVGKRNGEQLYAFVDIFGKLDESSPLWEHYQEDLFWSAEYADEFQILPAWSDSKRVRLRDGKLVLENPEQLICLPLAHQPRLEEYLSDPGRRVCWSLLTERQVRYRGGRFQPEYYLHLVLKHQVLPRLRPNLLATMPVMENGSSCLRWILIQNGQAGKSVVSVIDRIPLSPIKRKRSYEGARKQLIVRFAISIAQLADDLDANLVIGEPDPVDKRHGDEETNTMASRWPYATVIQALENKATDHQPEPVAVLPLVYCRAWQKIAGEGASAEDQIRAVARIGWNSFQQRLKKP